jgi:hypothetical protein
MVTVRKGLRKVTATTLVKSKGGKNVGVDAPMGDYTVQWPDRRRFSQVPTFS